MKILNQDHQCHFHQIHIHLLKKENMLMDYQSLMDIESTNNVTSS